VKLLDGGVCCGFMDYLRALERGKIVVIWYGLVCGILAGWCYWSNSPLLLLYVQLYKLQVTVDRESCDMESAEDRSWEGKEKQIKLSKYTNKKVTKRIDKDK
jgi:hypothetical protein